MSQIVLGKDKSGVEILVGKGKPSQVIAEVGVLTWGEKERGFLFVDEAVKAGIKFLKFQCMNVDNFVSDELPQWQERLKQRALNKDDFIEIMEYGKKQGVICFASTHSEYDMIELVDAGMEIIKIGGGDSNNVRMIDMCLATGKPVILSLGLITKEEIYTVLDRYRDKGEQLIPLFCHNVYPTPPEISNLKFIKKLKEKYPEYNFGYSDHTVGYVVPLVASTFDEVCLVEKHFCLPEDRIKPKFESLDIPGALTPEEMKIFLRDIKEAHDSLKEYDDIDQLSLENRSWAQKAVTARVDIPEGKIIEADDLRSMRPYLKEKGHISIADFYEVVGMRAIRHIEKGDFITKRDITSI